MNKQMRDLLAQIEAKKNEASDFMAKAKGTKEVEEIKGFKASATTAFNEMEELQKDYALELRAFEASKTNATPTEPVVNDRKKEFINGIRYKINNAMSEGSDADGGYTVPQDIQTRIIALRESKDNLSRFVTVEPVTTLSGSRVFKTRAQQTGFAEVLENGAIAEKATPQFTTMPFSVKKYAGFMKVTNELLADSDQAIEDTLVQWVGDESRVTRNQLILTELNTKAKTAIATVDDIKTTINVTLDPAFRTTSIILTNQTGFNYLDQLKDNDGNYLLQPSVTASTGKMLNGLDIEMQSNKDLPNDTTVGVKAPIIIGDLKEAIVLFDRQSLSIKSSDVAGDAFTNDVTLFRAIEREQVKTRDAAAFVYGQIVISA